MENQNRTSIMKQADGPFGYMRTGVAVFGTVTSQNKEVSYRTWEEFNNFGKGH